MLRIRFNRKGKKNQPFFRIVVVERHKDPFGDYLEDLGFYNPLTKKTKLKEDRIKHWLSNGAKPTGSVHNLLISKGIIKGEKKKVSKYKKEEKEEDDKQEGESKEKGKGNQGEKTTKKQDKKEDKKEDKEEESKEKRKEK